jgi:outer membrane immunogenic protein
MLMAAPVTAFTTSIISASRPSLTISHRRPLQAVAAGWAGSVAVADYQFGSGSGFWSNWVVGAFADYDFMNLHRNFAMADDSGVGNAKESSAWAVGGRIGYLVTPNVFTYWNGGYTETRFDQINLSDPDGDGSPFGVIGA